MPFLRLIGSGVLAVGGEPNDVVRRGGISDVEPPADGVEHEGGLGIRMVTRQYGLVFQIPLGVDRVAGDCTYAARVGPVLLHRLAVRHLAVVRMRLGCSGVEASIDMDTAVNLERGVEHRAAGALGGLRRHVRTSGDIHRARGQVVLLQIVAQVIDSVLHAVLRVRPTAPVVRIGAVRTHIADGIRLRIRTRTQVSARPCKQ